MRKEQALEIIHSNQHLVEIARYEPSVLYHIVDLALLKSNQDRWQTYEELKSLASQIDDNQSDHPELATSRHYEALIQCIDALLPSAEPVSSNPYEDEIEEDDEDTR